MSFTLDRVYLDTSLIVSAIYEELPFHAGASQFSRTLLRHRASIVVSDLVRIEFGQAVKGIANDPQLLPEVTRRRYRLHRWGDLQDVRERWYIRCFSDLDAFLDQFATVDELQISPEVIRTSQAVMAVSQLDAYDAIHVATAFAGSATTLAAVDAHFRRLSSSAINVQVIR